MGSIGVVLSNALERNPRGMAALAAVVLAIAAYANGLGAEFVLDDRLLLVNNPELRNPQNLIEFFRHDAYYFGNTPGLSTPNYRPLMFVVFWFNSVLWPESPLGLHLFSLGLHITATLLVLAAIPRLLPDTSPLAAGIGACLFAVHPVHSGAVAWVTALSHPMATVFVLAAYLFHHRYLRTKSPVALIAAAFTFMLALLTSETATAFPFFILANDWIRDGRPRPLRAAPYFLLLGLYAVIRSNVLGAAVPLILSDPDSWLRLPRYLAEYLRHLILPWPQPLYLAMPAGWEVSPVSGLTAGLGVSLFLWFLVRPGGDRKGLLIAAAWICAALLPPLAVTFNPKGFFALRSLYMPSVGVALLAAWLVSRFPLLQRRGGLAAMSALVLISLGATVAANRDWRDDGVVFGRIISFNAGHALGYMGLGSYRERTGEVNEAMRLYEKAIALAAPREKAVALEKLGLLLGKAGQSARSLAIFRQMIKHDPTHSRAWVGVGNNLYYLGRYEEASDAYRKAHAANARNREACYNLATVLRKLGKREEAARYDACAIKKR